MDNDKTQGPQARATLDARGMDLIFRDARTYNAFLPDPVSDETLRAIYDLLKWGPTSANTSPMRVVFVRSKEAKELLCTALFPTNIPKTMSAPVTAIVAHDTRFAEHLPKLFPHNPGIAAIFNDEEFSKATAFRNGSLQGAYLILAARAFGLDCGPMSGFDNAKVDAAFFPDGRFKSNFLVNLGHGDPKSIFPRSPRLDFEEACEIR